MQTEKYRTGTLAAVSGPLPTCLNYEGVSSESATLEFWSLSGKGLCEYILRKYRTRALAVVVGSPRI
eukprot:640702-Pyramimonas_sp.AAC.1